ncbi:MAG: lytic transglycosylase F [Thermodesulfobacteriota bacterium]|nr:lytic transglycosylase F [Thermodesulfobacteriota bacterium]
MKKRYIRVLTTFNKTNFFLSGNTSLGFEYSLLREYEKFLNKKIRRNELKVVLEFIPVSRDELMSGLVHGFGDIAAAGLTITPQRLKEVDFTNPYLSGVDEIVVVNKNIKGLKNIEDLSGHKVFVRQSSSYYESLLELNKKLAHKRMKPVRIVKADENLETEDILELVNSGAIGITISDSHIAKIWSEVFKDLQPLINLKVRTGSKIAWMVRKNNPELKESLNKFIKAHKKGTLLGNIYFNRYYKNTKWIKNPLAPQEKEKLHRHTNLFKKYSSKYMFDWMLVMALAYQESGLDQNKKNPSGATGIMQVLPSTAADRNIRIKDVHLLKNNIHAGVKYLALLRDRYFNDEGMRERDKVRFALAAYNAGPTKIKRVRKLAGKMGLDPNRWFRNAEMAALKIIGQETVRYVSNINKYYVLFRFAFEKEKVRGLEKKKIMGNVK